MKLFKKWKDFLTQYTNVGNEDCQKGRGVVSFQHIIIQLVLLLVCVCAHASLCVGEKLLNDLIKVQIPRVELHNKLSSPKTLNTRCLMS